MEISFKGVLFDEEGRVLLGLNPRNEWELLGGRADPEDEGPAHTIAREFHEEAGLDVQVSDLIDIWYYDIPRRGRVAIASYVVSLTSPGVGSWSASEEHSSLRRFSLEEVRALDMPAGYKRTISAAAALSVSLDAAAAPGGHPAHHLA